MTKISSVLNAYKPLKKFNNYKPNPYTYKIIYPPVLKDSVSNRKVRERSAVCGQEMMVLLSCWRKNDFIESKCSKEIMDFNSCVATASAKKTEVQTVKTRNLTSTEVNELLRRHPQPPTTIKLFK